MENLVGRKIKGFKFESTKGGLEYHPYMDSYIGKVGEITWQCEFVEVKFKGNILNYPLPEALNHLVEEPTIPELGDGVEMEVSCTGELWSTKTVLGIYKGKFITDEALYTHARPIPVKKLTMQELESIVGFKFEIV